MGKAKDAKITLRIPQEYADQLRRRIPWGMQEKVMRRLVAALIESHEAQGDEILYKLEAGRAEVLIR